MSLTTSGGPLSREPAYANYAIDGPAHRILFEPFGRRVRAHLAGETVLDSRRAFLLHETGLFRYSQPKRFGRPSRCPWSRRMRTPSE